MARFPPSFADGPRENTEPIPLPFDARLKTFH